MSGSYNAATAFSCTDVGGVEEGATVYYSLTSDGSEPAEPFVGTSIKLAGLELCGINQNGGTSIRIRQVDAAGNLGPVSSYQYVFDTRAPAICKVSTRSAPIAYVGLPLRLRVIAEVGGKASVDITGLGTLVLNDQGTAGDPAANDGVYEGELTLAPGADIANATVTAHFTDAAGNPAPDVLLDEPLFIDRTPTVISGAIVKDTVWTAIGSPYFVTALTVVDASLTLQPGTVVIFQNSAQLKAAGTFSALGTADRPIALYRANLLLDGAKMVQTFDPASSAYLAGPKLDHVEMRDGQLAFGALIFDEAGAYVTNSTIGTLTGVGPFYRAFGVYVARSWIGTISNRASFGSSRITNSYIDTVSVDGYTFDSEISHAQIGSLNVDRWHPTFTVEHCNITQTNLTRPTFSTPAALHQNNMGGGQALVIVSGDPAHPQVDATANYWGAAATAQMSTLGNKANIDTIVDFYDDPTKTRVDYKDWLSSPVAAGPDWSLPVPQNELSSCKGNGGAGGAGSAGAGGAGSGGAGGTGSGGAGGTGGAGSGAMGGTSGVSGGSSSGGASGHGGGSGGVSGGSGGTSSGGSSGHGGANGGSGGSGGGTSGTLLLGACNDVTWKFCEEFLGPASQQSNMQSSCTSTWQGTCSTSNVLGKCTFIHGSPRLGVTGVMRYYQGVAATAEQLKSSCEAGLAGTWTSN